MRLSWTPLARPQLCSFIGWKEDPVYALLKVRAMVLDALIDRVFLPAQVLRVSARSHLNKLYRVIFLLCLPLWPSWAFITSPLWEALASLLGCKPPSQEMIAQAGLAQQPGAFHHFLVGSSSVRGSQHL